MSSVIDQLVDFFLDSKLGSRGWLSDDNMKVYVRRGVAKLPVSPATEHLPVIDEGFACLVIADMQVFQPGKGLGTLFIKKAHLINPWNATVLESVSKRFSIHMVKEGWQRVGPQSPVDYFKLRR